METIIRSTANPKIKQLVREKNSYFMFEGNKLVRDVLCQAGPKKRILINENLRDSHRLNINSVEDIWYVPAAVLKKVSDLQENSDFILFLDHIPVKKRTCPEIIVVLDNIQDPGNAGSIFRCAAAFGIPKIVFTGRGLNPRNTKFIRSAQDSLFQVEFETFDNLQGLLTTFRTEQRHIYLTSSQPQKRSSPPWAIKKPCVVILGSEGSGLDTYLLKQYTVINIPQKTTIDSLNVGIAACILFYEISKSTPTK